MYEKYCSHCKKLLPLSSFYHNRSRRDGYDHLCKDCCKEYRSRTEASEESRARRREYQRNYQRRYLKRRSRKVAEYRRISYLRIKAKNPQYYSQSQARYRAKPENRAKFNVRMRTYARRAELLKARCEMCGSKSHLELHHPDYNKPLYVHTLCKQCHGKVHRKKISPLTAVT